MTFENMFDLLKSNAFIGILTIGTLLVLISGGIDISFAATATVSQYVMALVIIDLGGTILSALIMAVFVGTVLGMINGVLIHNFRIPSIIATIATMNIYYGLLIVFTGGKWIYSLPDWFRKFAEIRLFTLYTDNGLPYGLSVTTFIWIIVTITTAIILNYTLLGRSVYALGGDRKSCLRIGFNIFFTETFVYSFMGFLAGVAGVVQALLIQTIAPNAIVGKELDVFAAVVLGGASLTGGRGSVSGAILGVALLAILRNGMTLMAIPAIWFEFLVGIVIIVSVGFSSYQQRLKSHKISIIDVD
jgi:simple sugar transport system permease protein